MSRGGNPHTLYTRWLEELWNGDLDRVGRVAEDLVTRDFLGHWPGRPALVRGAHALAETVREGRRPFEGLRFHAEVGPIVEGQLICARWRAHGTYAGDPALPGVRAEPGTVVEFHGHDILRHSGGRLAEYWVISETEQLMAQLGAGGQGR
ncbi:ester cyclase [Streptomyces sodiiphilus]